jgi:hypothetical protein
MINIKGVEVLEVVSSNLPSLKCFLFILLGIVIIFAGMGFLFGWLSDINYMAGQGVLIGAIVSLVIVVPLVVIYIIDNHDKPEQPRYKVFVTKDVNMEEFLEEYIIISQEGKILTVEKIKNNEK